jgi:predicted small lipoprotein YifL
VNPRIPFRPLKLLICVALCGMFLIGCGQTGSLYLPDPSEEPRKKP